MNHLIVNASLQGTFVLNKFALDSTFVSWDLKRQLISPSTYGSSALCNPGRRTARSDPPPPAQQRAACCRAPPKTVFILFLLKENTPQLAKQDARGRAQRALRGVSGRYPRRAWRRNRIKIASYFDQQNHVVLDLLWARLGLPLGPS